MTIDEIKSVSIVQFLETEGYQYAYIHRGNYWYHFKIYFLMGTHI